LRAKVITRLRVLTDSNAAPSLEPLRRLGAQVRAFPSSAVRVDGGVIYTASSVIKPDAGKVLVIDNPEAVRGAVQRFETYWAQAKPVGAK
jgi:hypothetical protein